MLFRLGSTTKMFTASAVAGLAVEGKIDLDTPVSRYIAGLDESIGKLTANQLLSHTSGLRDEAPMFGSHDEAALGNGIHIWKAAFLMEGPAGVKLPQRLELVPGADGRIEFVFSGGRAFRRAD